MATPAQKHLLRSVEVEDSVPLCVDLDGTLLRCNSLYECAAQLVRQAPLCALLIPFWLLRGHAFLWQKIMDRLRATVEHLPYREEILTWLRCERNQRPIVLVTAAHEQLANRIAAHLGLFDSVLASSGRQHLRGNRKRAVLVERYGDKGFDYVGDSQHDITVWRSSRRAYCVAPSAVMRGRVNRAGLQVEYVEDAFPRRSSFDVLLRLLRVHQWLKNLLVFVPVILSHRVFSIETIAHAAVTFAAFSCCASATYIINDILDLEADRQNPSKRKRPIPSALISIPSALSIAALLLAVATALATLLPAAAVVVLGVYFATTLLYSAWLKKIALVDVFALASLYAVRVLGGGAATGIPVSAWTIAFFLFLFLSLALLKRYAEAIKMSDGLPDDQVRGRGYRRSDVGFVSQCGVASGLVAVLVFALYIHSPEVHLLYKRPDLLWLLAPLLAYGTLAMWLAGHRGEMDQDPIVFAAKSRATYVLGLIGAGVIIGASI